MYRCKYQTVPQKRFQVDTIKTTATDPKQMLIKTADLAFCSRKK